MLLSNIKDHEIVFNASYCISGQRFTKKLSKQEAIKELKYYGCPDVHDITLLSQLQCALELIFEG